jgi:DNA-binding PadR family transcriptional regulator
MARSNPPLAPTAFFILLALASGEKHGYAIMRESRSLSDGSPRLGPATLYTTIQRLLDSRSIEEASGPADGDTRRRYYRLTKQGRSALDQELRRMELLVEKSAALRPRSSGAQS